jgi:hypothetical protein
MGCVHARCMCDDPHPVAETLDIALPPPVATGPPALLRLEDFELQSEVERASSSVTLAALRKKTGLRCAAACQRPPMTVHCRCGA